MDSPPSSLPGFTPLLAQEPPAGGPGPEAGGGTMLQPLFIMGAIFLIFYFLIIRPQSRQEKLRREKLGALKKKDRVLLGGGIYGIVADVRDEELTVRISENPDVKVRVRRSAVAEVLTDGKEKD